MKIVILGNDGYLGRALEHELASKGHRVAGIDNLSRRWLVREVGSESLFPLCSKDEYKAKHSNILSDLSRTPMHFNELLKLHQPDAVIHLAEQPSAPYSHKDRQSAYHTIKNNTCGTLNVLWGIREFSPETHLIKLGTMGEYGDRLYNDANREIPEDFYIGVDYGWGSHWKIPTPKQAGSFYHWSKVFDSQLIEFCCRTWGLRATDINQGVVYGTRTKDMRTANCFTRFDYDSFFGTVINRFAVQALLSYPLTVYGEGGQTRGFININDSIKALRLIVENPPSTSELRVVNQLTEVLSVLDIAERIRELTGVEIQHIDNPRAELEQHSYNPQADKLRAMGLTDPILLDAELPLMLDDLKGFVEVANPEVIKPVTNWK